MASRSDQLHSHQFTRQRVVGALAMRDPDPVSSPLRRTGGAVVASMMIAVLAVAAAGVYGLMRPGNDDSWRAGDAVIVERETGARFVFLDGALHPVVNYSSALLLLSSAQTGSSAARPATVLVSRSALRGVARGVPLGIAGAPDLLPTAGELVTEAWTLCSRPLVGRGTVAGAGAGAGAGIWAAVESVLLVGGGAPPSLGGGDGGGPLGELAVIAVDPSGELHLLWHGRRHAIRDPDVVLAALAWPRQAAVPVAPAVLNAVPPGAPLGRMVLPQRSGRSTLAGLRVGQVFVVENQSGGRQFGVVLSGGVADITEVQAGLLLADGANGLGGRAISMSQAQYATAVKVDSLVPAGDVAPPARAPQLAVVSASGGVCASFAGGAARTEVSIVDGIGSVPGEARSEGGDPAIAAVVDWVAVPAGRGAIVEALAGPMAPSGALAIVTDDGVRYPVPSAAVLDVLGYPSVRPLRLPAALVALLPSGPALDPTVARRQPD